MFDVAASPEWMSHPDRPCAPGFHATPAEVNDHAELWFPTESNATKEYARRVCSGCPVATQCLDYAMRNRETGIWGATTDVMRESARRRARDNKKDAAA